MLQYGSEFGGQVCSCSVVGRGVIIAERSKVWHWANIMDRVIVGADCMIGSYVQLDPDTRIGNRVRIQPFSAITGSVGPDSFIGPHVVFVDARHPPGRGPKDRAPRVGSKVVIGAHAVVMDDVGDGAVVGAGAVVTKPVPAGAFVLARGVAGARV